MKPPLVFRVCKHLLLVLFLCVAAAPLRAQTTYNYDGGGTSALWSNPTNWADNTLPTFNTNAVLSFDYTFPSATNVLATGAAYTVSLSGGTIQRGAGVSEVFGNLNVGGASTLDFGLGATGTFQFQSYSNTESALITLQNFLPGNKLQFLASSFGAGDLTNFSFGSFDYSTSTQGSYFTITAIPEPSTYLAAAGLLAVLLWSSRRRLLKDTKAVLGLRIPMRDRLEKGRLPGVVIKQ
jgi:hypothetical protein